MAARTNKRDPRAARTLRRISFVREVKQSFLIICEGKYGTGLFQCISPDFRQY